MSALEIKQEIRQMIDQEDDIYVLEAIRDLFLNHTEDIDPVLKERMISRALQSEEDIREGRIYTIEEFKTKMNTYLLSRK